IKSFLNYAGADSCAIIGPVCGDFRRHFRASEKVTTSSNYNRSVSLFDTPPPTTKINGPHLIYWNEIQVVPLLLLRWVEWNHFCVQRAAEVDNCNFFDRLKTTNLPCLPGNAHCAAVLSGNLKMMVFLVERGAGFPDSRSFAVAEDLMAVGWLRELPLHDDYYTRLYGPQGGTMPALPSRWSLHDHALK
ncbi:unnamed protein product, partial [Ectocarpus sp. 6 AP-2014]